MGGVRGRFLGLPHCTTPAAVTANKNIKMSSFKSSASIQKTEGGPDRSVSDNQSLLNGIYIYVIQLIFFPFRLDGIKINGIVSIEWSI